MLTIMGYLFSYYLAVPLLLLIGYLILKRKKENVEYLTKTSTKTLRKKGEEDKERYLRRAEKKMKKYQTVFVVLLLIGLPLWGYTASAYCEFTMHRELAGRRMGPMGKAYDISDPVYRSLGPSYDTDKILEKMREDNDTWLPEKVDEQINLDALTRYPGRFAVYILKDHRYILTYSYLSPYPVIKSYGFLLTGTDEFGEGNQTDGEELNTQSLILIQKHTIIYPLNPAIAQKTVM